MTSLVELQKKYKHLKQVGDGLIESESGDGKYVLIGTKNYNFHQDIVNTKTGERYQSKYYEQAPLKRIFDISKRLDGISYAVRIPRNGGYALRRGTYLVGDSKGQKLIFSTADKAIEYAKYVEKHGVKVNLI